MSSLCDTWLKALNNPQDANAVAAVRSQLVEILNHVGSCDICADLTDRSESAEALFLALSPFDEAFSDQERADIEAIEQAWSDNEAAISEAVTDTLLNSISGSSSFRFNQFKLIRPLDVFLATNAVNMLVYSRYSQLPGQLFELRREGLFQDEVLTVPRDSIVFHMRHAALLGENGLAFYNWMLEVAESVPGLFLQFVATPVTGGIRLEADTPSLKQDLRVRWLPAVRREVDVPAAVTAVSR